MKQIFLTILISLSVISCTKTPPPEIKPPEPAVSAAPTVAPTETTDAIPSLALADADRACIQDSDCEAIGTQCSCSCGGSVNIISAPKYAKQWEEMCRNYQGKVCKINCNGKISCKNKLCTYVQQ